MILFHSPASPYVRKVVVLLHELGQTEAVTLRTVTTTAFASDESLMAANPLARLPALQRDEGATLYDSRVITQFLDAHFDGGFYPVGTGRWEHLTLEATGDGIMDSAVSMSYELRLRPENERSQNWVDAQWGKIHRALSVLDERWMSHLSGRMTMAQISVACALSYLDFRHDERGWRDGHLALAEWHTEFDSRASMQATRPPES